MKRPSLSPSFLVQNSYSYCFRIKVPRDLRAIFNKSELRYSVKTGYLSLAKRKSRLLAGLMQQFFAFVREHEGQMKLESKYVDEVVQNFKDFALNNYVSDQIASAESPSDVVGTFGNFISRIAVTKIDQQAGNSNWVSQRLDDILLGMGYELGIDYDHANHKELVRKLMAITAEHLQKVSERLQTEYPELELYHQFRQQLGGTTNPIPTVAKESPKTLVSEVIPLFVAETKVNWRPKVEAEVLASLDLFIECIGDIPIQSITRAKVAEYKMILTKLPPHKNKDPNYRGKSIEEILKTGAEKTLSVERVNKNLQRAGALFDYAIRHGIYEGPNPATLMQLPKDRWETEKRAPFSNSELERLLRSEEYLNDEFDKSYKFWTPILALFHGIRQNEIAGLFLNQIKESEEGVWYFDLTSRKSRPGAARRVAPIHPFVVEELRFIERLKTFEKRGLERLFPELPKGRDGYGKNVSRWFNEQYKAKCGIVSPDNRMRDFHSFRTTFITRLRHKKVHDRMLKEVVGHSVHLDVTDTYTDPYPLRQLLDEVLAKAEFHKEIDLSHLKKSKWVIK